MENKAKYLSLLSEIVAKQAVILGPEIALLKAKSVPGLVFSDDGKIIDMKGSPDETIQKLVDAYVDLSGQIVKIALGSVFAKYPTIKKVD